MVMLLKGFAIKPVERHRASLVPNGKSHEFCSSMQHHISICHSHVPSTFFTDSLKIFQYMHKFLVKMDFCMDDKLSIFYFK